jgi:hypothetical protein
MTAEQARQLTKANKMSIQELEESITIMANAGYNYAGWDSRKIDIDPTIAHFMDNGFLVVYNPANNTFRIEW